MSGRKLAIVCALCLVGAAATSQACPTCYGQAEGPMIDGMNKAILAMIGIVGFVLTGFVALFVSLGRRARSYHEGTAASSPAATTIEKGAV